MTTKISKYTRIPKHSTVIETSESILDKSKYRAIMGENNIQMNDRHAVIYEDRNLINADISGVNYFFDTREGKFPSTIQISNLKVEVEKYLEDTAEIIGIFETINSAELTTTRIYKTTKLNDGILVDPIYIRLYNNDSKCYVYCSSYNIPELRAYSQLLNDKFKDEIDYETDITFGVLLSEDNRLHIQEFSVNNDSYSKNLNIGLNYGDDFIKHHEKIVNSLKTKSNGLMLFHGPPGTGKTTYIKHLSGLFGGEKMFIFVPTTFIEALVSPSILPVLLKYDNSVLVMEDAEKAIKSRDSEFSNESLVSSLLNIGDGILGSMLSLNIILTFNTAKEKVDEALMRKGRLVYEYEFDKLSVENSKKLIATIGKTYEVTDPMSLAEIYNIDIDNNHVKKEKEKVKFGFAT